MNKFKALLFSFLLFLAQPVFASSTEQWVAGNGQGLTYGAICGAEITTTSLVAGNAVLCSTSVTNGTALDIFADFSINFASETWSTGSPYFAIYIYLLNEDGTTYGDGQFTSAASGATLSSAYLGCIIAVPSGATQAGVGTCRGVVLPPGTFKIVVYNNTGTNTASSGNSVDYRTYNRQQH